MLIHPPEALRPYVVAGFALGAAMAAGVACACAIALLSWQTGESALEAAALGCWALAATLLALGLAQVTWAIQGGPAAGRKVVGGDALLNGSLLLTGATLSGTALMMVSKQLAGEGQAPDALVFSLIGVSTLLGVTLLLGFGLRLANLILRGPTFFVLEDEEVERGGVLRGYLEVPFAAERALELDVLIELLRSQPGPSPDDPREQAVIFSASVRTRAVIPMGARRSGARIEVPLEFAPPSTANAPEIVHFWHMEVTPAHADVWWNAVIEPEIDWKH